MVIGISPCIPFLKVDPGFAVTIPEVWILATNFWDDNGVWMDLETWND